MSSGGANGARRFRQAAFSRLLEAQHGPDRWRTHEGRKPAGTAIYRLSRRRVGRDVEPIAVYAHAPRLLLGYGLLEQATAGQHRVPERLKALAETKAAALVNCEFCCDIASSIAREAGVSERQLLALPRYASRGSSASSSGWCSTTRRP